MSPAFIAGNSDAMCHYFPCGLYWKFRTLLYAGEIAHVDIVEIGIIHHYLSIYWKRMNLNQMKIVKVKKLNRIAKLPLIGEQQGKI